jgi:hypothetical protein
MNLANLTTPLGLAIAGCSGASIQRGPHGLRLATSSRLRLPRASAFTVGDVVITPMTLAALLDSPTLLAHEARHALQYAACLGLPMIPLYLLASGWSWLRCRDFARQNVFERLAGLVDGGYETPLTETG